MFIINLLEHRKSKNTLGTIHFIGIGGIGMSGIAEVMHNLGYKIRGSDISSNSNTERLKQLGIEIRYNHRENNIKGAEIVVVSSAINRDNIEYQAAVKAQIPVISRAEMLAELMRFKIAIAISGSHGKTTTTSLIACMFEASGSHPTVINGGIINNKATNAYIGSGDYFIVEADESDATFINIPSTIAVITNIDREHLDFYKSFDNVINSFRRFLTNLPFYGFAVACIDHPVVRNLVGKITTRKIITYGIKSDDAHIQALNIDTKLNYSVYDVKINLPNSDGKIVIEQIVLPTPGEHNILNSLAAIAIATELDFGLKTIKDGFKSFKGIKRRFMETGEYNNIKIIDDYAHHPSEIIETLKTARNIVSQNNGRIIAVFQPHRYSRVSYLFSEFVHSFNLADQVYISEIYAAGEQNKDNISHISLVEAIANHYPKLYVEVLSAPKDLPRIIKSQAKPNDVVLMMGAGDITKWAAMLPEQLKALV